MIVSGMLALVNFTEHVAACVRPFVYCSILAVPRSARAPLRLSYTCYAFINPTVSSSSVSFPRLERVRARNGPIADEFVGDRSRRCLVTIESRINRTHGQ